MHCKTTGTHCS